MVQAYENFIEGTTTVDLDVPDTSIQANILANVPVVTSPDYFVLVIDPEAEENGPEIVHVTAHTSGSTSATIARAQEGTSAVVHTFPRKIVGAWTRESAQDLADGIASNASDIANNQSTLSGHVGAGGGAHADVVDAGAAGFMTGADKTKLNAIEAGATADQSASEILTAVKTVDGSGSGIDADLLDGLEGAAYLPKTGGTLSGGIVGPTGSVSDNTFAFGGTSYGFHYASSAIKAAVAGVEVASFGASQLQTGKQIRGPGGLATAPGVAVGADDSGVYSTGTLIGITRSGVAKIYCSATETYITTDLLAAIGATAGSDTVRRYDAGGGYTKFLYFSSSENFKKDIVDADLVEAAKALRPVQFTSKLEADEGKTFIGFIAEEVSEAIPLAKIAGPDGEVRSYSETAVLAAAIALAQDNARRLDAIEASLGQ